MDCPANRIRVWRGWLQPCNTRSLNRLGLAIAWSKVTFMNRLSRIDPLPRISKANFLLVVVYCCHGAMWAGEGADEGTNGVAEKHLTFPHLLMRDLGQLVEYSEFHLKLYAINHGLRNVS